MTPDKITREELAAAEADYAANPPSTPSLLPTAPNMAALATILSEPVEQQKVFAAQLKSYLDYQLPREMREQGALGEGTRKWADLYNQVLTNLQRAVHGDRSVSLHLHQISHADIAGLMRRYDEEDGPP